MPKCMDKTAKAMADQGYNLVKYPRADIDPLNVVADVGGRFEWLGPIDVIWKSAAAAPDPSQSEVPNFEYKRSDEYKGAFGVQILQGLIKSVGGSAKASISRETTLTFQYHDPERHQVPPLAVGSYLKDGDLDLQNPFLAAFLKMDEELESDFFVITEVLRSKRLTVVVANSNSAELEVDVQAVAGMANGTVAASAGSKSEQSVVFEGTQPLTFAFKAFEIGYKNGGWAVLGVASNAEFLSAGSQPTGVLLRQGSPVMIRGRS